MCREHNRSDRAVVSGIGNDWTADVPGLDHQGPGRRRQTILKWARRRDLEMGVDYHDGGVCMNAAIRETLG
jgi:hypothetical protein